MNRHDRRAVISGANKLMARYFSGIPRQGACLYYAWAVCQAAREQGHRFLLQAGTAFWPRLTPEQDRFADLLALSGEPAFGYQWELAAAQGYLARNMMPEMHCWAADPAEGMLIDLTTGDWPRQCLELLGIDWPGVRPPDHIWCSPTALPVGVVYAPSRDAGLVALRMLKDKFVWKGKPELGLPL